MKVPLVEPPRIFSLQEVFNSACFPLLPTKEGQTGSQSLDNAIPPFTRPP